MTSAIPPFSRRSAWLAASLLTTGAVALGLLGIANLPFDEESPLARANLALFAIFAGGLIAAILAAVSLASRERRAGVAFAWLLLNLTSALCAPTVLHHLARLYYRMVG